MLLRRKQWCGFQRVARLYGVLVFNYLFCMPFSGQDYRMIVYRLL